MEKFLTAEQLVEFDQHYQAVKAPTANNLGQKTFDQLVEQKVIKILRRKIPGQPPNTVYKHTFKNSKRLPKVDPDLKSTGGERIR